MDKKFLPIRQKRSKMKGNKTLLFWKVQKVSLQDFEKDENLLNDTSELHK